MTAIAAFATIVGLHAAQTSGMRDGLPADVESHADDVTFDAARRELELKGHVRVDAPPFHLRSEELKLRRTARGIEVEGEGKLAFCPCLGTPLTLSFEEALVAPPSDLVLKAPRLEIYGVPVLWLPYFWLRAPDRPGLLPPDVSYRGRDGPYAGAGVHVPWSRKDRELGLDLRAGGYVRGGYAFDVDARTPDTRTRARWDWISTAARGEAAGGGGLSLDARGSMREAAWDVSLLRGRRALVTTLSLDEAARPLDRARGEVFERSGPVAASARIDMLSQRGASGFEAHAGGPVARVRVTEALGDFGAISTSVQGGAYRDARRRSAAFAVAELGAGLSHALGIFGAALDVHGEAAALGAAADDGASGDARGRHAFARARAAFGLPLVRAFASADPSDPWRHRIEPRVAATGILEDRTGVGDLATALVPTVGFVGPSGADAGARRYVVPEAGFGSAFGRWGARDGIEADVSGGVVMGDARAPVARARIAAGGALIGASAEGGGALGASAGVATTGRLRIGEIDGLHLEGRSGGRAGIDPTLARFLAPPERDVTAAYFATSGFSAGGTLIIPWTKRFTTRGGADVDLESGTLLGVRGSVDMRDACGCVTLRLFGSERLGRDGIDVWLALELGERAASTPRPQ